MTREQQSIVIASMLELKKIADIYGVCATTVRSWSLA